MRGSESNFMYTKLWFEGLVTCRGLLEIDGSTYSFSYISLAWIKVRGSEADFIYTKLLFESFEINLHMSVREASRFCIHVDDELQITWENIGQSRGERYISANDCKVTSYIMKLRELKRQKLFWRSR